MGNGKQGILPWERRRLQDKQATLICFSAHPPPERRNREHRENREGGEGRRGGDTEA